MDTLLLALGIIGVILLIPLCVIVLSMSVYIGKVWAIRLMFKNKKGGDE